MSAKRWIVGVLAVVMVVASGVGAARAGDAAGLLSSAASKADQKQWLEAFTTAEQAMVELTQVMPFMVRNATLVETKPEGFGIYTPRLDNAYKIGETIFFYLEPLGYEMKIEGPIYKFALSMDLYILNPEGKVLFGQEKMMVKEVKSRAPNREFMLNGHINLTGAPAGSYIIKLVVKDLVSTHQAEARLPIRIK